MSTNKPCSALLTPETLTCICWTTFLLLYAVLTNNHTKHLLWKQQTRWTSGGNVPHQCPVRCGPPSILNPAFRKHSPAAVLHCRLSPLCHMPLIQVHSTASANTLLVQQLPPTDGHTGSLHTVKYTLSIVSKERAPTAATSEWLVK